MFRRMLIPATLALCLIGGIASAQEPAEEGLDATVLSVDYGDRTLTVRFEKNQTVETYHVSKDAEFYTWDGIMEHPQAFADIEPGTEVMLEFDGVEGTPTLRKVTSHTEKTS